MNQIKITKEGNYQKMFLSSQTQIPQLPRELWEKILYYKTGAFFDDHPLAYFEYIGICPCEYCEDLNENGRVYGPNQYCDRIPCPLCDLGAAPECGARCNCGNYDSDDSQIHPEHYMQDYIVGLP